MDSVLFSAAILRALRLGRQNRVNILIHGAGDGGKSFLLRPLGNIFRAFLRRGQCDWYPLQGIHEAQLCLLQDVRYETFGLP